MIWDILNSFGRLMLTFIVIVKLSQFRHTMNAVERMGLGMMGAGSFLTAAVIWERNTSPFQDWSVTLLTYGAVMFLAGRTWRDRKHKQANDAMAEQGRIWAERRGK